MEDVVIKNPEELKGIRGLTQKLSVKLNKAVDAVDAKVGDFFDDLHMGSEKLSEFIERGSDLLTGGLEKIEDKTKVLSRNIDGFATSFGEKSEELSKKLSGAGEKGANVTSNLANKISGGMEHLSEKLGKFNTKIEERQPPKFENLYNRKANLSSKFKAKVNSGFTQKIENIK